MDAGPIVAMAFGLFVLWALMISAMVAIWNARGEEFH